MICKTTFRLKKDRTPYSNCFCRTPELIENYDKAVADTTQTWDCHHRLETHNSDGERRLVDISSSELTALDMYFDRPPEELIFLTPIEHISLHKAGKPSPNKGKHLSEETKAKLSATNKGHLVSEEAKRKMSEAHKGKHRSEETRKKMSEANRGHLVSEETKRKISESLKGRKQSEEARKKMSETRKGHLVSEETKRKISEAKKGIPPSDEHRKKQSKSMKGKHWKLVDGKRVWD